MTRAPVLCSNCGRQLQFTGSMFDDILSRGGQIHNSSGADLSGYDQWLGSVCTHCNMVFCEDCQNCTWASPCRNCGRPIEPAMASNIPAQPQRIVRQIPSPSTRQPVPGGTPGKTQTPANVKAKKWWEFWK